jgi:hypothetical protein
MFRPSSCRLQEPQPIPMRKVELFSFPISPSHTVFLLPQTQNGVLSLSTECDDIEETTADRNEVQIRQLNQTETEEPCDVPKENKIQTTYNRHVDYTRQFVRNNIQQTCRLYSTVR